MANIYSLQSDSIPESNTVIGFRGHEALSKLYRFEIGFQVGHGEEFDLEAALGQRAALTADRGPGSQPFVWNGIVTGLELLQEFEKYALYMLTLSPELWALTMTCHSRIYTDKSIPDIVQSVLDDNGISNYQLQLQESYSPLEHVCQYKESDFDFIARLMEREGMYFFFEQQDGGEKLMIVDNASFHKELHSKPFRYHPISGYDASAGEALFAFRCKFSSLPSKVKLTDYDYNKPSLSLEGNASVDGSGKGDIVIYGENFKTPSEGKRYATVRAQEISSKRNVYYGHGQAFYLRAGYSFKLSDHPRGAFNEEYLAVELVHHGNQAASAEAMEYLGLEYKDTYRVEVKSIKKKTQFRAERITPQPRIHGVVDGVVDGAEGGAYANIDDQGRYKVKLFFDEAGSPKGSASTYVRMLQPHGGSAEGFHFPLRVDTEVHVLFLGGDPDRPVIVGVAHNKQKPSVVTSSNKTFNVIQTGSLNRIELDDLKGSEFIRIFCPKLKSYLHLGHGPYNFIGHTEGNGWIYIGGNFDVDVLGNMTEDVTGTVDINYMSTMDITVKGAVTELFKTSLKTTVTGPVTIHYTGKLKETVDGHVKKTYNAGYKHTVNGGLTHFIFNTGHTMKVSGGLTKERLNAGHDVKVTGALKHHVTGGVTENYDSTQTQTVAGAYTINANTSLTITTPALTINAPQWTRLDTMSSTIRQLESRVTDLEQTFKATSFSGIGLRIEGVIVDTKVVGVNMQFAGAVVDLAAFKLDNKPFKARTLGAKAEAAGPNIHITAITIYL